jgi:hypothetical protein
VFVHVHVHGSILFVGVLAFVFLLVCAGAFGSAAAGAPGLTDLKQLLPNQLFPGAAALAPLPVNLPVTWPVTPPVGRSVALLLFSDHFSPFLPVPVPVRGVMLKLVMVMTAM